MTYRKIISVLFLITASCSTLQNQTRGPASLSVNEGSARLEEILRPFVKSLDRDLWVYRYEMKSDFQPQTVIDVGNRISPRATQFFDADYRRGADTGPGVYVSVDPVATSTWGGPDPQLFAMKIKQGAKVLVGDQYVMPPEVQAAISEVSQGLGCTSSSTQPKYGLGSVVGYFRMNQKKECRESIITALRELRVQVLSYGFDSVMIEGCRTTGTAMSIIDASGIALNEVNFYSRQKTVEGNAGVTPFIKSLFKETQSGFYAQTLLADMQTWDSFKNQFGFFRNAPTPSKDDYMEWRSKNVFRCGKRWSIEDSNPKWRLNLNLQRFLDPEASEMIIKISLLYRQRFESSMNHPDMPRVGSEMRIERLRGILLAEFQSTGLAPNKFDDWKKMRDGDKTAAESLGERALILPDDQRAADAFTKSDPQDRKFMWNFIASAKNTPLATRALYNKFVYQVGQIPLWSGDENADRIQYAAILGKCLAKYSDLNLPMEQIVAGECGMDPEN